MLRVRRPPSELYDKVQQAAYEALATRPAGETFVMTNALCRGSARERKAWDRVVDLAIRRQVALIPVVLEAEPAENERRLQADDRIGRKMTHPQLLRSFLEADQIQKPEVVELLVLNVTRLSAEQASRAIGQHVGRLAHPLAAAGERHRAGASQP